MKRRTVWRFNVQNTCYLLPDIKIQERPLLRPDELFGRQNDPAIGIADGHEIADRYTERGKGADKRGTIVVVRDTGRIGCKASSWEAMVDERVQGASGRQMLKENVGSIPSSSCQPLRVFDHHSEKRTRECFNHGLSIDRHAVPCILDNGMSREVANALVGMVIEQLADWGTRLTGLSNLRPQAARQNSLGRPVSTDDIEALAKGTIKGCRNDLRPPTISAIVRSRSGSIARNRSISHEAVEADQSSRQIAPDRRVGEHPTSTPMTEPLVDITRILPADSVPREYDRCPVLF